MRQPDRQQPDGDVRHGDQLRRRRGSSIRPGAQHLNRRDDHDADREAAQHVLEADRLLAAQHAAHPEHESSGTPIGADSACLQRRLRVVDHQSAQLKSQRRRSPKKSTRTMA